MHRYHEGMADTEPGAPNAPGNTPTAEPASDFVVEAVIANLDPVNTGGIYINPSADVIDGSLYQAVSVILEAARAAEVLPR